VLTYVVCNSVFYANILGGKMNAVVQAIGVVVPCFQGVTVRLGWCWEEWAVGWADMFAEFGIGDLIIGPLHIHVTWPVDWPV
jgi:hypothetical protein